MRASSPPFACKGTSHYLPLGGASVWLYGDEIPAWLPRLKVGAPLITRSLSLFDDPTLGLSGSKSCDPGTTLPWVWALRLSSPERAILEALNEPPDNEKELIFRELPPMPIVSLLPANPGE